MARQEEQERHLMCHCFCMDRGGVVQSCLWVQYALLIFVSALWWNAVLCSVVNDKTLQWSAEQGIRVWFSRVKCLHLSNIAPLLGVDRLAAAGTPEEGGVSSRLGTSLN